MHNRLRPIKEVQFGFAHFVSHFIRVQIFQIDLPLILSASNYFKFGQSMKVACEAPVHYRLRPIKGGQFRLVNFASHFIRVQIFQIDFLLILSASKYFR